MNGHDRERRTEQRLLVLADAADDYARLLDGNLPDGLELLGCTATGPDLGAVRDCTVILGDPASVAAVLDNAGSLAWVQSTYAGVDALCRPGLRRDYLLTAARGIFGPAMREYVFAHVLALERRLMDYRTAQDECAWRPLAENSLVGRTLGVCGLGLIGQSIAATAAHFGLRVLGCRRTEGALPGFERVFTAGQLPDFLAELDYLVLALPDTPGTGALIDREALTQLRPGAVLINVGRGSVVDETALIDALERGHLRHAVLDVFANEPLPESSPLWALPNVTLTPHVAAPSRPADVLALFRDNYADFMAGKPMGARVDFARGY